MEIVVLDVPDGQTIGWEIQLGRREGRFILDDDGVVHYRHPHDERDWPAGTLVQFRRAAEAWASYGASVVGQKEDAQKAVVDRLQVQLREIGVLSDGGFWSVLAEQTEQGLL